MKKPKLLINKRKELDKRIKSKYGNKYPKKTDREGWLLLGYLEGLSFAIGNQEKQVEWFKREFVRKFKGETTDMIDVTVLINESFNGEGE